MKKNLFLLFSIYFFVVQPLIIGMLRGQTNFFRLGIINLVAIILISILSSAKEGTPETDKSPEKKIIHEPKTTFQEHFRTLSRERKKTKELAMPSIISFLAALIIFFIFQYNASSPEIMIVFSLCLGFIIFISLTFIFKHRITKSFRALIGTKIYIILLILGILLAAYDYYQTHKDYQIDFSDYIAQNFFGPNIIPTSGYVYTGEGMIIGSGINETTGTEPTSSDVLSDLTQATDIAEETGTVLGTSLDTLNETDTVVPTSQGKQKIMDAVIYLVRKYKLPLVTTPNVKFTYVTTKNPYYAEWRTAYANKMIGKDTNPSKYIICESYIVMKGLAEGWNISYTPTNVITQFRNEAVKRDALNGCKKGYIVDAKNL